MWVKARENCLSTYLILALVTHKGIAGLDTQVLLQWHKGTLWESVKKGKGLQQQNYS